MYRYGRKVAFIDCYINGIFNGNMGIVRQKRDDGHIYLGMFLQNVPDGREGSCPVYLRQEKDKEQSVSDPIFLTEIPLRKGQGEASCILTPEMMKIPETYLEFEVSESCRGICRMEPVMGREESENGQIELKKDKWKHMQEVYPNFYPFREQGPYVILRKEDVGLLPKAGRSICESEFFDKLYHTYRHMIVGEYVLHTGTGFFLGVPGMYEEVEQSAAASAGFIGYEFCGAGGYYLYPLGERI